MATARKILSKKTVARCIKSDKIAVSSIITVRISDEEKERFDEIMKNLDIKRYSDVMRMALQMLKPQNFPDVTQVNSQ